MEDNFERYMVSQVGVLIRGDECLILKDNKTGFWLLPGGRADIGETGEVAFKRELKEEIGFDSFENLGVVDYDIWYTANLNLPVCAIANLIRNDSDDIKLSSEHSEFKWVPLDRLGEDELFWPKAERMIRSGFKHKELLEKNGK